MPPTSTPIPQFVVAPPPRLNRSAPTRTALANAIREMRQHPHQWALVLTLSTGHAATSATRDARRHGLDVAEDGHAELTVRTRVDGRGDVYVQWVPTVPNTGEV